MVRWVEGGTWRLHDGLQLQPVLRRQQHATVWSGPDKHAHKQQHQLVCHACGPAVVVSGPCFLPVPATSRKSPSATCLTESGSHPGSLRSLLRLVPLLW